VTPEQAVDAVVEPWRPSAPRPRPMPAQPRAVVDPRDLPPQHADTGTSRLTTTVPAEQLKAWREDRDRAAARRRARRATHAEPPALEASGTGRAGVRLDEEHLDALAAAEQHRARRRLT
jgi:hypothetical protein